jgi:PAS domain S-box-containing protein
MTPDTRKILSLLLIPVYLILIAVFLAANIKAAFNPPILLLVFNSLFLGLIPLYVAYVAYVSFRGSGSTGVLLKGTGMLVLGLGAIAAGIVNYLPDSMNANITVQNTSFCAGALLQLIGILIALSGTVPQQKPDDGLKVTLLYGGSVVIVFSFAIAAVTGAIPPFFIPGVGFTPLREILITNAIEFFALAAGILLWLYYREREEFFFWYSIGLALIGIGLLAVHFPSVLGSPLGWVGRSAQYLGGVYILIAFIALGRSARQTGIPPSNMLSRFFGEAATSYRALIETATDAIVVFDSADRVIVWNRAAEKMFGYTLAEATGSSFLRRIIPDEFTPIIKSNLRSPVPPHADSALQKSMEITARRKDGSTFPMELALSRHMVGDTWVSTCIIRDLTDRMKALEALRESEERFRSVMDNSPVVIFRLNLQTKRYEYFSPACSSIYGYSPQEMIEMSAHETRSHVHPDDLSRFDAENARIQEEGNGEYDVRWLKSSGEYRWLSLKINIMHDATGLPLYRNGFVSDITERKKAEEVLRESEELYRTRFNALIEGFCVIEVVFDSAEKPVDYRFLEINEAFERQTGLHNAQGKLMRSLAPDHEKHWFEIYGKIAVTGEPLHFENEARALNRWYEVRAFKIGGKESRKVGICFNDITEPKKAEVERAHLAAIVEDSDDAIIGKSLDGTITSWNAGAVKIYGYSVAEVIGKNISILVPPGEVDDIEYVLGKIKSGESFTHYETQRMKKDGTVFPVSLTLSPIRDSWGNLIGASTIARNITERKKAEKELMQKNDELNAAYEEIASTEEELRQNIEELSLREQELIKSEADLKEALAEKEILLAEIHHRVKNNLTAFISLLSLDGTYEDTEAGRALRTDLQNRARSMALIHETLYRTRNFSNVDMETYLNNLVSQIAGSYAERSRIRLVIEVHEVTLDIARATTAGLIINELVTNSLKYAFPPGFDCMAARGEPCTIRISLAHDDGTDVLTVADNGCGLPEEFDPLTTKSLGLKLVTFLARHQLRAEIEVHTEWGFEFIFRLKDTRD